MDGRWRGGGREEGGINAKAGVNMTREYYTTTYTLAGKMIQDFRKEGEEEEEIL